jgi:hypothetical protein
VEGNNLGLGSLQALQQFRILSVEFHVLLAVGSHAAVDLAPETFEQLFLLKD